MIEAQLFKKPNPTNKGISQIYPKTDLYWYYMNYDGIENRIANEYDLDLIYALIDSITNSETITADTTITTLNHKIVVDASLGDVTITLPSAIGIEGKEFVITRLDNSANTVTIQPQVGQTIFGVTSEVLYQYETLVFASDNFNYL